MLTLYAAPRTRSIRVAWLLEELDVPYELELGEFKPTSDQFFIQDTPTGKYPTIEHDGLVLMESGAIIEYLTELFPNNLKPPAGSQQKAVTLQWLHYADATAFAPLGIVVWLSQYRSDGDKHPELIEDARNRVITGLKPIEDQLTSNPWITGPNFSAADIMLGFTVIAASSFGLTEDDSATSRYITRIQERPGFQTALSKIGI